MAKANFIVTARVDEFEPGDRLSLEVGDDGLPVAELYRVRVRPDTGKDERELEAPSGGKVIEKAEKQAAKIIADAEKKADELVAAGKAEADRLVNEALAEAAKLAGNGQ